MANAVGRLSIKMNVVLSGFMTELSRFKGILVCVLIGIPMTGIALAQDSVQARGNESQTKPGVANLLDARGSAPPPTSSQPQDISDQQARTRAILADVLKARTPVHVSLVEPVDARKNQPSAELIAKTSQELRSEDGRVVVPAGATIVGLIRQVTLRSPDGQEANIEIAVDHVLLTDGSKSSLAHALQLIGRSQPTKSNELPIDQQARTAEAMRALASPASMGGGMLRDGMSLMDASGDPGQRMGAAKFLTSGNEGVVALPELYLSAEVSGKTNTPVLNAKYTRLRLSRGTDMILRINEH
ncbi:MAG: hypothetical protein DMG70_18700 [Acidobacteria bacterium]|nr:MAG: hypothetical protein DMG70_18700 [Acidobacteriota bacterium]